MATDSYLATTYQHDLATVDDGAELLAAIETVLTAAGWTETAANVWKSPDAARFIEVTFTLPAADKLQFVVEDYVSRTFSARRVGTVDTGLWSIHAGPYFLYLGGPDANRWGFMGLVDHFPAPADSHDRDAYCGGPLDSADVATSENFGDYLNWDETGTEYAATPQRVALLVEVTNKVVSRYLNAVGYDWPNVMYARVNVGGDLHLAGVWYQAIVVDPAMNIGEEFQAPLDIGTLATFRVLSISVHESCKLAARVA